MFLKFLIWSIYHRFLLYREVLKLWLNETFGWHCIRAKHYMQPLYEAYRHLTTNLKNQHINFSLHLRRIYYQPFIQHESICDVLNLNSYDAKSYKTWISQPIHTEFNIKNICVFSQLQRVCIKNFNLIIWNSLQWERSQTFLNV